MSWLVSFETDADNFQYASNKAVEEAHIPENQLEWGEDAIRTALGAAATLVYSGAYGNRQKKFRITLSGHANLNHQPNKEWADDYVSINIQQVREAPQ